MNIIATANTIAVNTKFFLDISRSFLRELSSRDGCLRGTRAEHHRPPSMERFGHHGGCVVSTRYDDRPLRHYDAFSGRAEGSASAKSYAAVESS
jgi:hypothetical protein